MDRRKAFALAAFTAVCSTVFAGCAPRPAAPITNGHLSAAIAGGADVHGDIRQPGKFVVIGDGCLGIVGPDAWVEGGPTTTFIAALPAGSTITDDDVIVFPDGSEVGLRQPFEWDIGGWLSDPTTHPELQIVPPDGCPVNLKTTIVWFIDLVN